MVTRGELSLSTRFAQLAFSKHQRVAHRRVPSSSNRTACAVRNVFPGASDCILSGSYQPCRDLCLLTFDDGLKEHAELVAPLLPSGIFKGYFFLTTSCIEEHVVLSVHKNHFLMASLEFPEYRRAFLQRLAEISPETSPEVDAAKAATTYRFDTQEVAELKLLLNFHLSEQLRQQVLDGLFQQYLGDEASFAQELYVSWSEARHMQEAGMILGGHSHRHIPLPTLGDEGQQKTFVLAQPC